MISIRIFTGLLSEEEIGNYYLLLTLLTLFSFTFFNPLGQYYGRHIISWQNSKNLLNATNVLIALRVLAIVVSLFFAYGIYYYFGYDKYYGLSEFLVFLFLFLIASTHGVLINTINNLGDRVKFIKFSLLTSILGLIISSQIVIFLDKSGMGWLYGVAISQLLVLVWIYKYIINNDFLSIIKIKSVLNKEYIKKILYFILPITLTLFLQWGQSTSYRFIVETKYSLEILGSIAVGLSISGVIFGSVENLASQYFNPIYLRQITNATKEGRAQAWNQLASLIIPIYLLLAMFVMVFAPYLVKILVAEKFHEVYIYTIFGAWIEFFRASTNIVYKVSQSEIKTNATVLPYAFGFIITISTLYLADLNNKLWAIPLILSITYASIFLIMFYSMKKLLPISLDMMNLAKVLVLSLPFGLIYFLDIHYFILIIFAGLYFLLSVYLIIKQQEVGNKN